MNYRIIGGDQKEYGPVTTEQLLQWVREGRVNAQTPVQPEGATDWKPLASFPELMPLSVPAAPAMTPGGMPGTPADAAARVRVPAILLIIAGGLGIVGALVSLAQSLFGLAMPTPQLPPDFPPELARILQFTQKMGVPMAILSLGLNGLLLFGGLSMLNLQRWGLALAVAIIALLCGNPCCCPLGLVGGIWALVVLTKPEVKSAFR